MAKKEKEDKNELSIEQETDSVKLSKLLIKSLNRDEDKDGKLAWNLATDLDNPTAVTEWIDTGSTLLNYAISNLRNGGIPVGKLTEISGEEASGKSLMCAHLARDVQKKDGIVAYLDTENAMNPDFMMQLGVDLNKLIYVEPGTIEQVGETIEKIIVNVRQKAPNKLVLIIWDSIAGTPSQCEIEGSFDPNDRIGVTGKAMGKMMRKLTQTLGKERIALVFTNQLRVKIGCVYGDPMTTPGGKAVPYHASVRVRLERGGTEKGEGEQKDEVLGVNTRAKVIKNRLGPPLRKSKFFISFASGVEDESSWHEFLHEQGVVAKANGWDTIPEFRPVLKATYGRLLERAKEELEIATASKDKEHEKSAKEAVKDLKNKYETTMPEGKDKGWQFRESNWLEVLRETPGMHEWVLNKLEQLLVVRYGVKPVDYEPANPESLMETEQVVSDLINPQ